MFKQIHLHASNVGFVTFHTESEKNLFFDMHCNLCICALETFEILFNVAKGLYYSKKILLHIPIPDSKTNFIFLIALLNSKLPLFHLVEVTKVSSDVEFLSSRIFT